VRAEVALNEVLSGGSASKPVARNRRCYSKFRTILKLQLFDLAKSALTGPRLGQSHELADVARPASLLKLRSRVKAVLNELLSHVTTILKIV
jgi:hypothetical protein